MNLQIGKILIAAGLIILLLGGLLFLAGKLNLPLGRLPGDIRIQRGSLTCLIPLGTTILLSIVLTVVFSLIARLFKN